MPDLSNATNSQVRILVTCGDPNGVGLELFLRSMRDGQLRMHQIVLCAPECVVRSYAEVLLQNGILRQPATVGNEMLTVGESACALVWEGPTTYTPTLGKPTMESGIIARAALEYAGKALLGGEYDAVVTLPVSKYALSLAGFSYPGQTEFFGAVAGKSPLMILACASLRVALTTIHVPIKNVAAMLNIERVLATLMQFDAALRQDFAIPSPRIAVLGLNPHAGEHGSIGDEEVQVIIPAMERANIVGITCSGPYAADGFFAHNQWRAFDGVVAQYHDQGLIPLKMIAGGRGVNITAGLPFVRTSPDHGTAYDIVGTGVADYGSFLEALRMAQYLATNRKRFLLNVSH